MQDYINLYRGKENDETEMVGGWNNSIIF